MDIGAHHPTHLSNTALFYLLGNRGINIEPDPELFPLVASNRTRDINLNIGIARVPGEIEYYRMSNSSLNTFSITEAHRMEAEEEIPIVDCITLP